MAGHADALRIAEVLAARLCHDLAGPVGSLNQALELVPQNGDGLVLARQAAAELARRVKLLRAAWTSDGPDLGLSQLRDLAPERLTLDLFGLPGGTVFQPPMARLVLNLILLAQESLPAGGLVSLYGTASDLIVTIAGANAAWPAGLALCLTDPDAALAALTAPRTLQMPLTALLSQGLGLRLSMLIGAGKGGPPPLRLSIS
jgi:histidine phosphotransferase ChpT